jgi:hypothetical protein
MLTLLRSMNANSGTLVRVLALLSLLGMASSMPCFAQDCYGSTPHLCFLRAYPNPIAVTDGSGLGVTTVSWGTLEIHRTLQLWVNGTLFCSVPDSGPGGNYGSCTTGKWVSNGTKFTLRTDNGDEILGDVTVAVTNTGGDMPAGCPRSTCSNTCTTNYSTCVRTAQTNLTTCKGVADLQQCLLNAEAEKMLCELSCNTNPSCLNFCSWQYSNAQYMCQLNAAHQTSTCDSIYLAETGFCQSTLTSCNATCDQCPN